MYVPNQIKYILLTSHHHPPVIQCMQSPFNSKEQCTVYHCLSPGVSSQFFLSKCLSHHSLFHPQNYIMQFEFSFTNVLINNKILIQLGKLYWFFVVFNKTKEIILHVNFIQRTSTCKMTVGPVKFQYKWSEGLLSCSERHSFSSLPTVPHDSIHNHSF